MRVLLFGASGMVGKAMLCVTGRGWPARVLESREINAAAKQY